MAINQELRDMKTPTSRYNLSSTHWIPRLSICGIMLLIALIGLIFTDINPQTGWYFWRLTVIVYAILSLGLSFYLRHQQSGLRNISLKYELLHWASLMLAVYLVTILVDVGLLGRMPAGLMVVILLAFSTFLAGIYIDRCFILIGLTLAIFVVTAALIEAYLSLVMVPVVIIATLVLIWLVRRYEEGQKASL